MAMRQTPLNLRINTDLHERLVAMSDILGITLSDFGRQALEAKLESHLSNANIKQLARDRIDAVRTEMNARIARLEELQ